MFSRLLFLSSNYELQRFVWGNMGRRKESTNGQQRIACEQKVLLSCNVKNCAAVELSLQILLPLTEFSFNSYSFFL